MEHNKGTLIRFYAWLDKHGYLKKEKQNGNSLIEASKDFLVSEQPIDILETINADKRILWQLCPKCEGQGTFIVSFGSIGAACTHVCDVCNGNKIIKTP